MSIPLSPLPERLRPQSLSEVLGQDHLLGADGMITRFIAAGHLPSCCGGHLAAVKPPWRDCWRKS